MTATLTRQSALSARPVQVPPASVETKNGKLYVTITYRRPGWQRLLGADEHCRRAYGLDAYGRDVYDACDGHTTVANIVSGFAKRHNMSRVESETAVTKFLKTLMTRGLIGMSIEDKADIE